MCLANAGPESARMRQWMPLLCSCSNYCGPWRDARDNVMRAFAVCLVGWLLAWPGWLAAIELSPAEAAGKRIYQQGRSDSGNDIAALVGAADIPMPASFLPCSSCHGADGAGRPEGGVRPPAITWQRLTVPYGQHTNGRS